MAIETFWRNLTNALDMITPSHSGQQSTAWLNRRMVDGFDPRDFDFLDEDERTRLEASVEAFREATANRTPLQSPTEAQLKRGSEARDAIFTILDPGQNSDAETFRIKKILDAELAGKLPEEVERLVYETNTDSQGEPAVWAWVMVTDDANRDGWVQGSGAHEFRDAIATAYRWTGSSRSLYIRFDNKVQRDAVKAGRR